MSEPTVAYRYRKTHIRAGWSEAQAYYGVYARISAPREALLGLIEEALSARLSGAFFLTVEGPEADPQDGIHLALADQICLFNMSDAGGLQGEALFEDGEPVYPTEALRALAQRDAFLAMGQRHGIDLTELLSQAPGYFFCSSIDEPTELWLGQTSGRNRAFEMKMVRTALEEAGFGARKLWGGTIFGERLAAPEGPAILPLDLDALGRALQARLTDFYATRGGKKIYAGWWMDDISVLIVAP